MAKDLVNAFSSRQWEFIKNSSAKYNLAHGSVRSGKTVAALFLFMQKVHNCPGNQIWMIGHTHDAVFHNCIRLLLDTSDNNPLSIFSPFCTWMPGNSQLKFGLKTIYCLGARDERSIGSIQGKTFDLCYCNEMTLYPENVIQMISTRLSMPHSLLIADMNPVQPSHKCKEWINMAEAGDKNYYSLHFSIDHNPFLTEEFKAIQRQTLTGLFYRRYYLGEWCLADGAIFDFLDKNIHIVRRPPRSAEFWLAGIDYGASNPFACLLVGYNSGRNTQSGAQLWVEKEYYWDPKKTNRQKTNSEFARDVAQFLDGYAVRTIYVDPSAESFQLEMKKNSFHIADAINDVYDGIMLMTSLIKDGTLVVCQECTNLIREMESYSWDPKASQKGWDEPIKTNDHACVVGDTLVSTPSGNIPINMLNYNCEIYNYNRTTKEVEIDNCYNPSITKKNAEIFELELEDGKKLRATGDHKVLTERGEVCLSELTLSDIILTWNIKSISEKDFI